jgi:hypothetical protein
MTALPIKGYAKEYTDPAVMLEAYAAHKQRLAKLFSAGISEQAPVKIPRLSPERRPDISGAGSRWDVEDTAHLRRLQAEGKSAKQAADDLGRSIASVTGKAWALGLKFAPVPPRPRPSKTKRDWLLIEVVEVDPLRAPRQVILAAVCEATGFSPADIRGMRRTGGVILARHTAYLMMKRHTELSLPQIARYLGGRDHTTILAGIASIRHKAALDHELSHQIAGISALINSRAISETPPVAEAA